MRTEFLCIPVLRVALGPREKLAGCKSALNPQVIYSTDRSKAVVLVSDLLFVALCSFGFPHCFFSYMCCDASIVIIVFNSCPLCFLFY